MKFLRLEALLENFVFITLSNTVSDSLELFFQQRQWCIVNHSLCPDGPPCAFTAKVGTMTWLTGTDKPEASSAEQRITSVL